MPLSDVHQVPFEEAVSGPSVKRVCAEVEPMAPRFDPRDVHKMWNTLECFFDDPSATPQSRMQTGEAKSQNGTNQPPAAQ